MSAFVLVHFRALTPGVGISGKVRPIPAKWIREHGALCQAFGLDPVRTRIDAPQSWGQAISPGRIQQAIVFWHDTATDTRPLGHLTIMREGERIPDDDPSDPRDFYNLSNRM